MQVRLVSITQSRIEGEELNAEQLLTYIARVSNPANQMNMETADRLLGYLIKNKHWSPFDMVNMTVEVVTSRAIAQQILRHWSIKPQEFSQRYAEAVNIEPIEYRKKADKNRQSSEEVFDPHLEIETGIYNKDDSQVMMTGTANELTSWFIELSKRFYKALLKAEVATECARFVLPLATQTTLYLNGSVRSWIHYMEQRCDLHAQKEHRLVAKDIASIFVSQFPNISKALGWIQ